MSSFTIAGRTSEQADAPAADKAPLTRTPDKKEVEDEVARRPESWTRATLHLLDGSDEEPHAPPGWIAISVFNLRRVFGGNDTADYRIMAYLELLEKRITGAGRAVC